MANSLLTPAVTRLEVLDGQGMGQTIWAVHGLEESQKTLRGRQGLQREALGTWLLSARAVRGGTV